MASELTFLIPGLFGARAEPLYQGLDLTSLELILSRAKRIEDRFAADCLEGMLCRSMRIPRIDGGDWPVAAITREIDDKPAHDVWQMRADPVHARAGLGEITLNHPHELMITRDESAALVDSVSQHFSEEPWCLQAPHPARWYIECTTDPGITTESLSKMTGAVEDRLLPRGEQQSYWRSVVNETQMLLHTHPVNEKRQEDGLTSVNSIWLWGSGKRPVWGNVCWTTVCCELHLGEALARGAGLRHSNQPGGLNGLLSREPGSARHLVVLGQLDFPARRLDFEGWRSALESLMQDWFESLVSAIRSGMVSRVEVSLGDGTAYRLEPSHLRRWWRRRQSFAALAQQ